MIAAALPIESILSDLTSALRSSPCALLRAPTGSGKTTRVPPALLDAGIAPGQQIVMLEPRRLAARAAAARIAFERKSIVGGEVGYHVRFDRKAGVATRILVVTEGILVRRIQDDPFLDNVGIVIFDEFHERNLDGDLALALARKIQLEARTDLRILVMSATLHTSSLRQYLGDCPLIQSEGKSHDVAISYRGRRTEEPLPAAVTKASADALDATGGDLLVFLPGVGEIRQSHDALLDLGRRRGVSIVDLYGDLQPEEQDKVLRRGEVRRIVLSTNVAESSVTLDGVTGVIDTGLARVLRYDPSVGLDRLELARISRSSATQRAGRAGRQTPGICIRLWSEMEQRALPESEEPELLRVDLTGAVLQLRAWGESDLTTFPWFEPPPKFLLERADALLTRLGALDGGRLTARGREMSLFPVAPRLARLLLEGRSRGVATEAALAAALLSERNPFRSPRKSTHHSPSDLLDQVHAIQQFEDCGLTSFDIGELQSGGARGVLRARDQYLRLLGGPSQRGNGADSGLDTELLHAIFVAFPDRLAKRREPGGRRALLVGGRGARLSESSAVAEPEYFVALDIDAGDGESLVRMASEVERDWLPAERIKAVDELYFDKVLERVVARRRVRFEDLTLTESQVAAGDPEAVSALLVNAALENVKEALPLDDPEVSQYLARVRCLREWVPELSLPEFKVEELLPLLCVGRSSFKELREAPIVELLQASLTHAQRSDIDREAPERLTVPSGSDIRLRYEPVKPPVLAVRIQEMFGLADTPRIARGRVPVLLHLLSPNHRLQQITSDLESFWNTTYASIRKELRARYPRHAWPEDPWTAQAQRKPKPRT